MLSSTSSNVLLGRGSEKAFKECLGITNVFHFTSESNHDFFKRSLMGESYLSFLLIELLMFLLSSMLCTTPLPRFVLSRPHIDIWIESVSPALLGDDFLQFFWLDPFLVD